MEITTIDPQYPPKRSLINGVMTIDNNPVCISRWFCYLNDKIKKIVIPKSVKQIGGRCANDCTNLEEITIPENVEYIGPFFLDGCLNLKKIKIH
jgi:hypothetical protein